MQIAAERGLPRAGRLALVHRHAVARPRGAGSRTAPDRFLPAAALAATTAMLTAGLFEYSFGDSEFLMLFLIVVSAAVSRWREA